MATREIILAVEELRSSRLDANAMFDVAAPMIVDNEADWFDWWCQQMGARGPLTDGAAKAVE